MITKEVKHHLRVGLPFSFFKLRKSNRKGWKYVFYLYEPEKFKKNTLRGYCYKVWFNDTYDDILHVIINSRLINK